MGSKRPNFFVVGAPKCGTTALYHALLGHPEVFLPHSERPDRYWIHKEPMHFCDDLGIEDWLRVDRREDYLALFADAGNASRVGECSALYLFSPGAPERIREFAGEDVRIIILLRPPVDWMRSWHHDCLRYAHESIGDFRAALDAEPLREKGELISPHFGFKGCLGYRKSAHFSVSVERYYKVFGRERVRVFLMEDLNREADRVLAEIAGFLGISTATLSGSRRENDSPILGGMHLWEYRLKRKLQSLPTANRLIACLPRQAPQLYRRAVAKWLPPLSDKRIDPELHRELIEEFRPEVARLGRLIGRDLSHWNELPRVKVAV